MENLIRDFKRKLREFRVVGLGGKISDKKIKINGDKISYKTKRGVFFECHVGDKYLTSLTSEFEVHTSDGIMFVR